MRKFNNLLITGGSGFIGSNFIRFLFESTGFEGRVVNLDAMTYAAHPYNLVDIQAHFTQRYKFVHGNICDRDLLEKLFDEHAIDGVVHFAAETHVDRSLHGPSNFVHTNVIGTQTLLDAALNQLSQDKPFKLFHHVSTDEVFGSLGPSGKFDELSPYDPRSPYSATKAASDHLVRAYHHSFHLPITITNCSNNYGPYQYPEKLIPLMIDRLLQRKELPIYGDGTNVRDWLHVFDHCSAIWAVMKQGSSGETYAIGGDAESSNIDLVHNLCDIVAEITQVQSSDLKSLIAYVPDRPGHDKRYAIDSSKISNTLRWKPSFAFDQGIKETVQWYIDNSQWVETAKARNFDAWVGANYSSRGTQFTSHNEEKW